MGALVQAAVTDHSKPSWARCLNEGFVQPSSLSGDTLPIEIALRRRAICTMLTLRYAAAAARSNLQFIRRRTNLNGSFNMTRRTAAEEAVFAPLQALLDGLAARDHEAMRRQLLPGGMATLIRDGQVLQMDFDAFVGRLPRSGTSVLAEVIDDAVIHIDENIAVIWASYRFLFDDKLHHSGTNIVSLILQDGKWLISGVADNCRLA